MFNFLKKIQKRKFKIHDDLKKQKINYVFKYLLINWENQLRGKVDLPAFYYAVWDMEHILKRGCVDCAYELAKKIIHTNYKFRRKNEI